MRIGIGIGVSGQAGGFSYAEGGFVPPYVLDFERATYVANSAYTTLDDATTFARTGTATYLDSSGVMQTAADGEARDQAYAYVDGVLTGPYLQIESEARTNLDPNSDDLSAWTTSSTTIAKDQTGASGGANEAHSITASGSNGTALEQITASSADHVWSCLMKRLTSNGISGWPMFTISKPSTPA